VHHPMLEFTKFTVVAGGPAIARLTGMYRAVRVTIALGLVACGNSHVSTPPPDGNVVGSDGSNSAGLTIPWTASPAIPGPVTSDITVTSMVFRVDSLRVVGDTGTSASHGGLELQWTAGETPPPTMFSDAPSGLYSKVVFHADGELVDYSWEIDGTVAIDGATQSFAIHDLAAMSVNIDSSAMLEPGGSVTLGVTFQMDQAFDGLDFKSLDDDDGLLVLDTDDSQMSDFRTKLQQAIVPTT
jgi:hypothetical protein